MRAIKPLVCNYGEKELQTIDFVAGKSEIFLFHTYFLKKPKLYNLESCTAEFTIVSHTNRKGAPYITKKMEIGGSELNEYGEVVPNTLRVELDAEDTLDLEGKYIYQVTIRDISGRFESFQGVMLIANNSNKPFFRS